MTTPNIYALEHLRADIEPPPDWLMRLKPGDRFPIRDFLLSRTVLYPGSGTDGGPVELFGATHSAHCFIYADYAVPRTEIEAELELHRFRGYHSISRINLNESDLKPRGWTQHIRPEEISNIFGDYYVAPYGFIEILERDNEFHDDHGPGRLAVLFLGADGIATYDALFGQRDGIPPPFGLVVVDYGFGLAYARFDDDGLLHKVAKRCDAFPKYIWMPGSNSTPWAGYAAVEPTETLFSCVAT